jgi:hypothetical protein
MSKVQRSRILDDKVEKWFLILKVLSFSHGVTTECIMDYYRTCMDYPRDDDPFGVKGQVYCT